MGGWPAKKLFELGAEINHLFISPSDEVVDWLVNSGHAPSSDVICRRLSNVKGMSDYLMTEKLIDIIDTYIDTNITLAQNEIVKLALEKIVDGDTILTFGRSNIVEKILIEAHNQGKQFKVVVASSRPNHDGKLLVEKLIEECTSVLKQMIKENTSQCRVQNNAIVKIKYSHFR